MQAGKAVRHYLFWRERTDESVPEALSTKEIGDDRERADLVKRMQEVMRVQRKSLKTERAYISWVERFLKFADREKLSTELVSRFISHLAVEQQVAVQRKTKLLMLWCFSFAMF